MTRRVASALLLGGLLFALTGCPTAEQTKLTPAKSGERQTTVGKTLDRADRSACEQYVAQLNQAAQMYKVNNEGYPPDLASVIKESGLPASELQNCNFRYDPASGRVSLVR